MELLKKQLERARFERVIEYITQNSPGRKHLNAQELCYLNRLIVGSQSEDVWRTEPTELNLQSGRTVKMALLTNPIFLARDLLSEASLRVANGDYIEGAVYLYTQLVLAHLFRDGNRRTAVAAVFWILREKRIEIKPLGLLEMGLGDIREERQIQILKDIVGAAVARNR